jgi:hypothetical protein
MSEQQRKARWKIAGFMLASLPAFYIAGYLALSQNVGVESPIREFPSRGLALSYVPLAWIESWLRHSEVGIAMPDSAGTQAGGEIIFIGHDRHPNESPSGRGRGPS